MNLIDELKRRNVFRVAIAYIVTAWVVLQFADVVAPILELPDVLSKLLLYALAAGFVPTVILAWIFEITDDGIKKEKDVDRSASTTHVTGRKLDFAIIAVLTIGILMLLFDKFSDGEIADKSVAVLPFVNMSSDVEQEYFSNGITEEILNALASVKELRVAGRTSSFAFKDQNDDLRRIGDTLGVAHILEGSVRRSGDRVRITAQLVQVTDGFNLWSHTYERELNDVFAIQDEIATDVLKQLKATLFDDGSQLLSSRATDAETYELYLRARQRMYTRSQASLQDAARLLDNAIERDPLYAPAQAQRGVVSILLAEDSYGTIPVDDANTEAKAMIDDALALDPTLPEGLAALGLYRSQLGEDEAAIEILRRSLDINPNQIDASLWLANALGSRGDIAGNLLVLENLLDKDPLYRPAFTNAIPLMYAFGKAEEASALIEKVRAFDPNDPQLLQTEASYLLLQGDVVNALRLAEQAIALAPNDFNANMMFSVALARTYQIERVLDEGAQMLHPTILDALGRSDEALVIARELAEEKLVSELFGFYNRHNRSQDLIDYIDERWTSLQAFADDVPPSLMGYNQIISAALAFSRIGDEDRFDEAMSIYESSTKAFRDQGIDNRFFNSVDALYYALLGEREKALDILNEAIEWNLYGALPLAIGVPELASLQDDPRFVKLEQRLIDVANADRAILGLDPIDPNDEKYWPQFR